MDYLYIFVWINTVVVARGPNCNDPGWP